MAQTLLVSLDPTWPPPYPCNDRVLVVAIVFRDPDLGMREASYYWVSWGRTRRLPRRRLLLLPASLPSISSVPSPKTLQQSFWQPISKTEVIALEGNSSRQQPASFTNSRIGLPNFLSFNMPAIVRHTIHQFNNSLLEHRRENALPP